MAILTVERGEEEGKSYTILEKAIIGRSPRAHIPLLDLKVSRKHCVIFKKGNQYFLQDAGSKNGTSLNGQILQDAQPLKEGDIIRVGLSWFRFQAQEEQNIDLSSILKDYEIVEQIGKGGAGFIYKAIHLPLNREVALKVLSPDLTQENKRMRDLFIQEASALTHLSHENIAMLLDFGAPEPYLYFTMELVEGISLEDYIGLHGELPVPEVLEFGIQIARGLGHAHRRGLIHRDIKPRNIMLTSDKKVKIVDFGLARFSMDHQSEKLDFQGLGTLEYISPEQAENRPLDERSDIYSLGITLYQMLTGTTPFAGDTPYTMIHKHLHVEPPPLQRLNPNIPKEIQGIVKKCLEKNPEDRYPDCFHLIRDLEKNLDRWKELDLLQPSEMTHLDKIILTIFYLLEDPWFSWFLFITIGIIFFTLFQIWI